MVVGAIVVSCVADPATRPSPAEAAQVLARLDTITNYTARFFCTDCDGPRAVIIRQNPTDGPFGPLVLSPSRPLSPSDYGTIYGLPPYGLPPPYWPPFVLVDSIRAVPAPSSPSLPPPPRTVTNGPPMAGGRQVTGHAR